MFNVCFLCVSAIGDDVTENGQLFFRAKWDGHTILGISEISGLKRVTEVVEHRSASESNQVRYSPGISRYIPITIKRPRTHDNAFEKWANKVWNFGSSGGNEISLGDYRKDITIELYDGTGMVLMAFKIYRCWPSEYVALSDLALDDDESAMEILILNHEGWERDYDIK
jgi:phage tail-like protein